jgi:CBS domain-containing protein
MAARAYTRGDMRCPACGHENLPGEDVCANCGTDLWDVERSRPDDDLGSHLFEAPLDALRPRAPSTIGPDEPADEAVARLKAEGIDCLLVTQDEQLVGIFTERDAILKLGGQVAGARRVRDLMTPDPVVLRGGDSLAVAVNKMAAGGFRHVPVVEDGRPVGVVTAASVFRYLDHFLA